MLTSPVGKYLLLLNSSACCEQKTNSEPPVVLSRGTREDIKRRSDNTAEVEQGRLGLFKSEAECAASTKSVRVTASC